jgi:zinc protease
MIQRIVSALGIEAWLVEDYAVPLIAVDLAFRGGASQDPVGRAGAGQMMAALLDEGAGPLDDKAFQLRIEENAVELHFSASRDQVTCSLRTLVERRAHAFELLRLAVTEPRFDADPVERIRQSLLAGLRREASDPSSIASKVLFETIFHDHPYGHWPRGTTESISQATRDDIVAQHRRILAKDNLVVSVVGAIDAVDAAAMLDEVFGDMPTTAILTPVPEVVPKEEGRRKVIDLDVPQTVLQLAAPGLKRDDPDFLAAYTVNHVLGGGAFSSWLWRKVREERGLAYSVSTQLATFARSAFIGAGVATRNDRAAESLAIIEAEMERMAREGPTEDELASAKKYIVGSYALRFDTSTKIANQLTQIQLESLGIDYIDRRNELVEAVTLADVKRAAGRMLGHGKPFVVAVGRPDGIAST